MLEALAPQMVEKFTAHQELYGKLQLAASLPGADLDQSGNPYSRSEYLASLAAESLLTGNGKSNKELEDELGLSLLQIHQLQEELEHYFLKYEKFGAGAIEHGSPAALSHSSDYSSVSAVEIVGSYAESGYRDIHLKLSSLVLADGRDFDSLSCKLVLKAGMAALELRANEGGVNALSSWPNEMHDDHGPFLLFIPDADKEECTQQQQLLAEMNTEDRQLVFSIVNVLRDHFTSGSIQGAESLSIEDIRDWRLVAIELAKKAEGVNSFISVDDVHLREELVSEGYNHIWFDCRNLQFGTRIYPSYSFKFTAAEHRNRYNLALEFRELEGNKPPLEAWPTEFSDEFGNKLQASLIVKAGSIHIDLSEQITGADGAMLSSIIKKLPILIESLAGSGLTSTKGWDFWWKQVAGLDQKTVTYRVEKRSLMGRVKARLRR
ncbi:hypothetical protein [Microbulbifer taiwanensis]|uniref:hypothetical protein n=1 Tax=Microbulbifer taiwanensis TaxID=986746 RepID=UPI0036174104